MLNHPTPVFNYIIVQPLFRCNTPTKIYNQFRDFEFGTRLLFRRILKLQMIILQLQVRDLRGTFDH